MWYLLRLQKRPKTVRSHRRQFLDNNKFDVKENKFIKIHS